MTRRWFLLASPAVLICITAACAPTTTFIPQAGGPGSMSGPSIILDDQHVFVEWDDGDTFVVRGQPSGRKQRARLRGYNTLESYGPVHRWGSWTRQELFIIAKKARTVAESKRWECHMHEGSGGYGRMLVDCPGLRRALLSQGLAHLFVMKGEASTHDLVAQTTAIRSAEGMWAKGAPRGLVTSLHSAGENPHKQPYNRVCALDSGRASARSHNEIYKTCQEVCLDGSCMVYVPYDQRYGKERPRCLRQRP